jgi:hypothetical protein
LIPDTLILLEALAVELQRPTVLGDSSHYMIRRATRNLGFDFQCHLYF